MRAQLVFGDRTVQRKSHAVDAGRDATAPRRQGAAPRGDDDPGGFEHLDRAVQEALRPVAEIQAVQEYEKAREAFGDAVVERLGRDGSRDGQQPLRDRRQRQGRPGPAVRPVRWPVTSLPTAR